MSVFNVVRPIVNPIVRSIVNPRALLSYIVSGRVLDLFSGFSSGSTTITDSSPEGNDATLYSGRFVTTDGSLDRGIVANCSAAGAGTYYLTGKVKPTAVTVARMTIDGATSSTITGLTANVWQDFQTATSGSITPSSIVVGWDGTTASAGDWSDVKLIDASTGATVARWQLNDSSASDLDGYPALDSSGNGYHGTHTGCAGGTGETTILQTAGMDWNRDATTYAGKIILVPESDTTAGEDALGNAILEPRVNGSQFNFFGDGEYASVADADSLDVTTAATWELWGNFYNLSASPTEAFFTKFELTAGRSWGIFHIASAGDGQVGLQLTANGTSSPANYRGDITVSNTLQHIVYVYNGTTVVAYINGAPTTVTNGGGGAIPASLYVGTDDVLIGAWEPDAPAAFADSKIARPKIYNVALTADEVLQNYNAQKGAFGL